MKQTKTGAWHGPSLIEVKGAITVIISCFFSCQQLRKMARPCDVKWSSRRWLSAIQTSFVRLTDFCWRFSFVVGATIYKGGSNNKQKSYAEQMAICCFSRFNISRHYRPSIQTYIYKVVWMDWTITYVEKFALDCFLLLFAITAVSIWLMVKSSPQKDQSCLNELFEAVRIAFYYIFQTFLLIFLLFL